MNNQNTIIDALITKLSLKNDAALARAMNLPYPVISKMRHDKMQTGASFIIRGHLVSGMPVQELIELGGLTQFGEFK